MQPLAHKLRPTSIDDVVGQKHLIGENKPITNMIKNKAMTNVIFYGSSGTGKTTVANILAKAMNKKLYKINATTSNMSDVREIVQNNYTLSTTDGIILYIDEIQYFNKKQQQILLEYMETGEITLIASTTENPFSSIFSGVLSRCNVFFFKPCELQEVLIALNRAVTEMSKMYNINIEIQNDVKTEICKKSNGDIRKVIGFLELLYLNGKRQNGKCIIDKEVSENTNISAYVNYQKDGVGDSDVISAFQKSIRGSDIDASLYYLGRLIKVGDLCSITRRLLVIASEDIGLSYPSALGIVLDCVETAEKIGLPEAKIPLSQAVIFLAGCPKSNSALKAIESVLCDIESGQIYSVPQNIKNAHFNNNKNDKDSYKYPHNYKNNYIKQQYLPKELSGKIYYKPCNNKFEINMKNYLDILKNTK